jgi:hypothetical protein
MAPTSIDKMRGGPDPLWQDAGLPCSKAANSQLLLEQRCALMDRRVGLCCTTIACN